MLQLHVVQAQYGDCLLLQAGEGEAAHFVLIDGGPADTYHKHLKAVLKKVVQPYGRLGLAILTHVDNDHICGMLRLLKDLRNQKKKLAPPTVQIDGLWHNTFEQNVGIDSEIAPQVLELVEQVEKKGVPFIPSGEAVRGIAQGDQALKLAKELGIPVNDGFPANLVLADEAPAAWEAGELRLKLIGPSRQNLLRLQKKWLVWLAEQASKKVKRATVDTSIPNLSSIMCLAEAGRKRILFTGDGTAGDILEGLAAAGELDEKGKIHVDVLKLPHHGSKRNNSKEFFEQVSADRYLISANGQNNNPEYDTLEWMVSSAYAQGRKIEVVITNETDSTRKLVRDYEPRKYGYSLSCLEPGKDSLTFAIV